MKRYPAFDPPEYVNWMPDDEVLTSFRERIRVDPIRAAISEELSVDSLLGLYRGLLRFRLHDIALQRWVKQGVISKAWLGTGEEAVTIGAVHALRRGSGGDVVGPMIRNAGACHEMGMPVSQMLRSYLGTADGPARGRDLHFGDPDCGVIAPVSVVGGLCAVVNGYALSFKKRREDRVALTFIGDGSTKSGEVHEAFNFAAVQRLPVVFVIQNNQVALGTRLDQHHKGDGFRGWGKAYGMPLIEVDGNHVLDVFAGMTLAVDRCRAGDGPAMIAAETFRMGGHATHDVKEARGTFAPELFESWGRRDPVGMYEEYLVSLDCGLGGTDDGRQPDSNRAVLERIEDEVTTEVEAAAREALKSRAERMPEPTEAGPETCYA